MNTALNFAVAKKLPRPEDETGHVSIDSLKYGRNKAIDQEVFIGSFIVILYELIVILYELDNVAAKCEIF
jgi:hypothetical protein